MSPIGGVGINLAVQDAVAAANILAEPLRAGGSAMACWNSVQERREFPTRVTQRIQIVMQERVIRNVLAEQGRLKPPLFVKLLRRFPVLRRIPARLLGPGVRPEHIRTPERRPSAKSSGFNSIGVPCGVRSAAWSQASR